MSCELLLAVLAAPGPRQLTILAIWGKGQVSYGLAAPCPVAWAASNSDLKRRALVLRLNPGATCTSLQQASLAWFPEVTAYVVLGESDASASAAWLARHQGETLLVNVLCVLAASKAAPLTVVVVVTSPVLPLPLQPACTSVISCASVKVPNTSCQSQN
jgi:hypothetical protein